MNKEKCKHKNTTEVLKNMYDQEVVVCLDCKEIIPYCRCEVRLMAGSHEYVCYKCGKKIEADFLETTATLLQILTYRVNQLEKEIKEIKDNDRTKSEP